MKIFKYERIDGWHVHNVYVASTSRAFADVRLKKYVGYEFTEYELKKVYEVSKLKSGIM